MVRFGDKLSSHAHPGWRYIDYEGLKELCDRGVSPRLFNSKLIVEINAVHVQFRSLMLSGQVPEAELRRAAVLNYLAVLKISKKFRKNDLAGLDERDRDAASRAALPPAVEEELRASSFCSALRDPSLLAKGGSKASDTAAVVDSGVGTSGSSGAGGCGSSSCSGGSDVTCPVCLDAVPSDCARLACQHSFCWACIASCAANGIKKCPVCRAEQSLHPVDIEIEALLDAADAASKYSPGLILDNAARTPPHSLVSTSARAEAEDPPGHATLKVMTWNICALTFPHAAPGLRLLAGIVLGGSWHDRFHDVSLMPLEEASIGRVAQQASYLLESGADLAMLQEIPGASYVSALLGFLGDQYEARYAYRAPSAFAAATWFAFIFAVCSLQLLFLEPLLRLLLLPDVLALTGGACGRLLLLAAANALRWRHSSITQFLLGSVAGQLLVLRKRSSATVGDDSNGGAAAASSSFGVVDFMPFEGAAASKPSKGYLDAFFSVRPRGVLQVSVPIVDATGRRSVLRVCTTHLPHASENSELLANLARRMQVLAHAEGSGGTVLLGGDFNPLPTPSLAEQFAPLLQTGSVPTNSLAGSSSGGRGERDEGGGVSAKASMSAAHGAFGCEGTDDNGKAAATRWRYGRLCRAPSDPSTLTTADGELCTWDLAQPLTRKAADVTPRTMQLDFLFVSQRPAAPPPAPSPASAPAPSPAPSPASAPVEPSAAGHRHRRLHDLTPPPRSGSPLAPRRGQHGARRAMLRAACRRGRAAAYAAARRTVLAPLPEYEEVHFFVGRVVGGRVQRQQQLTAAAGTTAHAEGEGPVAPRDSCCRLGVVGTELVQPCSFFVNGAPLSDHYGLQTTFRVLVNGSCMCGSVGACCLN